MHLPLLKAERILSLHLHDVIHGSDVAERLLKVALQFPHENGKLCLILLSCLFRRLALSLYGVALFSELVLTPANCFTGLPVLIEEEFLRVRVEFGPAIGSVLRPRPGEFEWRLFSRVGFRVLGGSLFGRGAVVLIGQFFFCGRGVIVLRALGMNSSFLARPNERRDSALCRVKARRRISVQRNYRCGGRSVFTASGGLLITHGCPLG